MAESGRGWAAARSAGAPIVMGDIPFEKGRRRVIPGKKLQRATCGWCTAGGTLPKGSMGLTSCSGCASSYTEAAAIWAKNPLTVDRPSPQAGYAVGGKRYLPIC
jgi:hypothetical protein